jgi:ComF family protein
VKLWQPFLDFLLKPNCPLCDRSANDIFCVYCARQLLADQLAEPWQNLADPVLAWGNYGGTLKRAIAQCKYQNQPAIGFYLGNLLGQSWLEHCPNLTNQRVIPIPLHADRQKQRGFNQAELIARGFCDRTKIPLDKSLHRIKSTDAQFQLSPDDRQQNLLDAFELQPRHRLRDRSVILIDDIYTTGATITAATNALQGSGVSNIQVAVTAIARLNKL